MKNLAGVDTCDITIKEELYLAGIPFETVKDVHSEVPYTIQGRIGLWKFERAWTYWIVSVEDTINGLPYNPAMKLHHTPNPVNPNIVLGDSIRCGGHCGCPDPEEYGASPVYDDELDIKLMELGYQMKYYDHLKKSYIDINVGEMSELFKEGKLDVERYVSSYHIDDQIGLNEFVKAITTNNFQVVEDCFYYDLKQGRHRCLHHNHKVARCSGVCNDFNVTQPKS